MEERYGILTEVGDLGLGFDPLSKKDQETIKVWTEDTNNNNEKEEEQ